MQTFFLKFADEAEAIEQLAVYRIEDQWQTASVDHALDVVGTIYQPTGETRTDEDGNPYPVIAAPDGFHVNLAIAGLPESLAPFAVTPSHPARVFAG